MGRPAIAGELHVMRAGGGNEFAALEQEADLAELRGSATGQGKEPLPAQVRERFILHAVGVEAVKQDTGDIIKA